MGRLLLYACILVLAVFVLAAAFLLQAGGGTSSAAPTVSVHDLSVAPGEHDDARVTTSGVLRFLHEPEDHFVISADGLAIVLRGYDEGALRALDGKPVTVTGRFGVDEDDLIFIDAESVEAD